MVLGVLGRLAMAREYVDGGRHSWADFSHT
jgi:hypothetical protein